MNTTHTIISCNNLQEMPSDVTINEILNTGNYIVLELKKNNKKPNAFDQQSIIDDLTIRFPDCSVFNCGGIKDAERITIFPVVSIDEILTYKQQIIDASTLYLNRCEHLESKRKSNTLSTEWSTLEHGEHCLYTNKKTGETVEASMLGNVSLKNIDPGFFLQYINSIETYPNIKKLLNNSFHSSARVLTVIHT